MGADFSRVRLNPLLDYAGVELKQGGVLLDADANELDGDRRPPPAGARQRHPRPRDGVVDHAGRVQDQRRRAARCRSARAGSMSTACSPENHGAQSTDPAKRLFDGLLAESQFADPIPYAAQPYLPNPPALPTAGHHLVYLDVWDREVTHLEAARPGRDRGRRRDQLAHADGLAGARARRRCRRRRTCATPDADMPGWSAI